LAGAGTLTLGSHLTVTGTTGQVYAGGNAFDNRGLISADPSVLGTAAGTITLSGTGWTNHGTIQAKGGDTVTLGGSWNNSGGTLNENASTLNLGGTVGATAGAADLGSVTHSGGTINLTGVLTNTGGTTLTLNNTTGSWNLAGGGLTGGTLKATAGNALVGTSTTGTLTGVTLDGTGAGNSVSPLDFQSVGGQIYVQGGLTLKGSTLQLGNAAGTTSGFLVFINGPQTVDGASAASPGTIVFGLSSSNALYDHLGSAGTLTLGSHLTVTGTTGQVYAGGNAFDNQGLISADPSKLGTVAGTITLTGTGWTNHGTIQALGGSTVVAGSTYTNLSGTTLTGGTWQAIGGGILRLIGANLTTDAAKILVDGTSSQVFSDMGSTNALANLASIAATGTFTIQNGFNFTPPGSLTNSGILTIGSASTLTVTGVHNLVNNKSIIQTGTGTLALNNNATLNNTTKGTYDIQSNSGITQSGGGSIVNAGTLKKSKGTGTSTIATSTLSNTGTVAVLSGTLAIAATVNQVSGSTLTGGSWSATGSATVHSTLTITSAGTFTTLGTGAKVTLSGPNSTFTNLSALTTINAGGSFTLAGNQSFTTAGALTNNGSITLSPGSVLTASGSFTQASTGKLTLQMGLVSGITAVGNVVSTTGTVSLGGSLAVTSTAIPAVGSSFAIVDNEGNSAVAGTFTGLIEGATFTVKKGTTTMTFQISYVGWDGDGSHNVVITRIS
jgi:hypothetical protein